MVPRFTALLLVALASLGLAVVLAWLRGPERVSLPDFTQWPAGEERKARFFEYLRPLLEAENERVLAQRARLQRIAGRDEPPGYFDRRWLEALALEYLLDPGAHSHRELVDALLLRVDAVPVSLGLAQAAKESGWGTSRFAREGNALFGQRCFVSGCGMVPGARSAGARHEVAKFATPQAAVASYVRNLNTHPDYRGLRQLRADLRAEEERVTGFVLAQALAGYSERGEAYIREIRRLIRYNQLGPAQHAP